MGSSSQDAITKIARCDLHMEPHGFISEGGIWSNVAPNYLITSDKRVLVNMPNTDPDMAFLYYVNDSTLELLEAMADHRSWDIIWDRLAVADDRRKAAIAAVLIQMYGKDNVPDLGNLALLF